MTRKRLIELQAYEGSGDYDYVWQCLECESTFFELVRGGDVRCAECGGVSNERRHIRDPLVSDIEDE